MLAKLFLSGSWPMFHPLIDTVHMCVAWHGPCIGLEAVPKEVLDGVLSEGNCEWEQCKPYHALFLVCLFDVMYITNFMWDIKVFLFIFCELKSNCTAHYLQRSFLTRGVDINLFLSSKVWGYHSSDRKRSVYCHLWVMPESLQIRQY